MRSETMNTDIRIEYLGIEVLPDFLQDFMAHRVTGNAIGI